MVVMMMIGVETMVIVVTAMMAIAAAALAAAAAAAAAGARAAAAALRHGRKPTLILEHTLQMRIQLNREPHVYRQSNP